MTRRHWIAATLLAGALLSGCASPVVPSTAPAVINTIVAATQRAAPTLTASPLPSATATATLTPKPTATATPLEGTPAAPRRILLPNGATSAIMQSRISPGESEAYVIRGSQAQPMLVRLSSSSGEAQLSMQSQGGTFFVRPGGAREWRGTLPQAGDYYLGVYPGSQPTDYTLSVQLVTRIRFKEGETAVTRAGRIPEGTVATYSVFAAKKDRLTVTLSGSQAALHITGFIDGLIYLDVGDNETRLDIDAPVTQDYVITIVPDPGESTTYVLDVRVE